jgi:hypothetical protein
VRSRGHFLYRLFEALRRRAREVSSHRLQRSETHFDGVETAARTDTQHQGHDDGDGKQQKY